MNHSSPNPLDFPGQIFDLALWNPNPTSSKTNCGPVFRVSFEVERETWDLFMGSNIKGLLIAAKACVVAHNEGEALEEKPKKGPYGKAAEILWKSGFFRMPAVWKAVGTDEEYAAWVRRQDCCIKSEPHGGDVVAAHVERINTGSGKGIKSAYAVIPVCDSHHRRQHQNGESAVGGKEFYDAQRIRYVHRWCWEMVAQKLGYSGISWIPPEELVLWAAERGVGIHLPAGYRAMGV